MKDLLVKLKLKNDNYNKGLKESEGKTEDFSSSVKDSMKGAVASFVAVTAVISQVKKGLTDLANETRGIAKVNAIIKATGGAAGIAAKDIEDLTDSIQKNTETSQDNARQAAAIGLTFRKITKEVFPSFLNSVNDIASVMGTDMKNSITQIGKVLEAPIKNLSALTRIGIVFTDTQKEMIKSLVQSGKLMEAQKVIVKELQSQFGGAARAIGRTWIGTINRAKNAFDDLRKEFLKGFFQGGDLGFLESFIQNQDKIKATVKQFAFDLTHNTILPEFKALFNEIFELVKMAGRGWGILWETAIKPVLSQVLKGWKLIAATATTALKNIRIIFNSIGDIAIDVFRIATMQIEIMITKATAKIKPLLEFVRAYLNTGSFEQAQRSAQAEEKLGEARVFKATMELADYDRLSGDISSVLTQKHVRFAK